MDTKLLGNISGHRILKTVDEMLHISRGHDGQRIAYGFSHVEDALFKYIKSYAYELNKTYTVLSRNLDFYEDAVGNLYVLLDSDKDTCVACSTHVDGKDVEGNFDGLLGAAVGLEIMRVFFEHEISLNSGFCLMVFRAGEGLSTGMPFLGSKIATALINRDQLKKLEYGVEKKVPIESVFNYKNLNAEKIYGGLDTGYVYQGRYRCLLEIHSDEKVGGGEVAVGTGCGACSELVTAKMKDVYSVLFNKDLSEVEVDQEYDADNFAKVGVDCGVAVVGRDVGAVEAGAKILAGTLVSFGLK